MIVLKVLITGINGLLGSTLATCFTRSGITCEALDRHRIDWMNPLNNTQLLQGYDLLLHTAANTNVELCEVEPEACYRDNVLLTEFLARACCEAGTRMVFISSTGIYGTYKTSPYHEYDNVQPTTHHHRAKRLAELEVQKWLPDALIIRTGWLFGGPPEVAKNFVARRIEESLTTRGSIQSNNEQMGSPTYSMDVAERVLALVNNKQSGVFNCVNSGTASRFDYVKSILQKANIDLDVFPTKASTFNRRAQVSNNEAAQNLKMDLLGYPDMRSWQTALADYITNDLNEWIKTQKLSRNV